MGTETTAGGTKLYLTFRLDQELFAFEVLAVKEVLEAVKITRVPHTPAFVPGVINLRGSVVPVVDLRRKFDLTAADNTIDTAIVIVEAAFTDDRIIVGALVDSVHEVIHLDETQREAPPKVGMNVSGKYIEAIGKQNGEFIIILNADNVFSEDELAFSHEIKNDTAPAAAVTGT